MDVATSERLLDVAGMSVLVRTATPDDLELLLKVLGERSADPHATAEVVELELGDTEPEVPSRRPDFEGPYGDHWVAEGNAQFRHHWGLSARISHDSVVLGGPAEGHRRWVAVRNCMLFVLAHLYMQRGRYLLHAAALHFPDSGAASPATLLVLADSGRGKSTLTYAALQAGFPVLGDDMVVVTPSPAAMVAQGVPRVLTVPSDVMSEAAMPPTLLPGDDRRRTELIGHELHQLPEPVTGVVLCDHDAGAGRLEAISAVETVEHLAGALVLSALAEPMQSWFPHATRLANGPRAGLFHAVDPEMRVQRAVEMLQEAVAGPLRPDSSP